MTIPVPSNGKVADTDITLYDPAIGGANGVGYMIAASSIMQDITPASTRRSDGDARYQYLPVESFWGQNDWSGGMGVEFPAEPTAFYGGAFSGYGSASPLAVFEGQNGADSSLPHQVTALRQGVANSPVLGLVKATAVVATSDGLYAAFDDLSLRYYSRALGTWTTLVAAAGLPAPPRQLCVFRGKIWICYGYAGANVQYWSGAVLLAPAYAFAADCLAQYGSMLFFARYDAASGSLRLNRYDPENPTAVADLAVIADAVPVAWMLVSLGAELYIFTVASLWKFTSANGNSGVLTGPLDRWRIGWSTQQGRNEGACVFQGALYYSTGRWVRRLVPGGRPATVFPVLGTAAWERFGAVYGLVAADDVLYVLMMPSVVYGLAYSTTRHVAEVFVWDGVGLHKYATCGVLKSGAVANYPVACFAHDGRSLWILTSESTSNANNVQQIVTDPAGLAGVNYNAGFYSSSVLDFGMYDIAKSLSRIGLAVTTTAATGFPSLVVAVDGTGYTFVVDPSASAAASTSTTPPLTYYYPPGGAQSVSGKLFQLGIGLVALNGDATRSQVLRAMTAIPNPNMPIRNGWKISIRIGSDVLDYQGKRLYTSSAAIATALTTALAYRGPDHITLYWVNGTAYSVRMNTRTIRRYKYDQIDGHGWEITFDAQELS